MSNCRTCKHNAYLLNPRIAGLWAYCTHPVALAKEPKWQRGDPAMVNWRTADVRMSDVDDNFGDCPTWEPATP